MRRKIGWLYFVDKGSLIALILIILGSIIKVLQDYAILKINFPLGWIVFCIGAGIIALAFIFWILDFILAKKRK